ncbi:rhamnulokinase [Parabacteroides sp. PF5-5]|uniref:rhamnulokinase n=1 Tax=unclassified Parabacteroides TaxID=2649774 RepID=UPI0024753391|nr:MULTISPECIES: rhamnulokinase family protein [unclassified Parabacteroides]MDH6303780.1 rhamnulokinase [Parabacteroides sp. PH5-39]MDH6314397.1 rhamnulokinase [Parabacteroides sp. PF5-13]MDH6318538.1 rhamnulokinase [Parabacteroides sp. PH5-13]MDH6322169.1 rhamnulokinase [Parabacteroides sp. PH5-8]MDH6325751.1 rhamnulokinase [Parabacteroides sp. PH5-41]
MKKHNFLAVDIGATSGRAVVASVSSGKFEMQEIHRFPNNMLELHGRYYWDIFSLYESIKTALSICSQQGIAIDSLGIDTWGVDYGFVGADGTLTGIPRAYRDPYTDGAPEDFFKIIPRDKVYQLTGIQIMNFNSLFQLYRSKQQKFTSLHAAEEILFTPDLLSYMLTGERVCEYTIASTSQILNPVTKQFETSLLEAAGVSPSILRKPIMPGTRVGYLTDALAKETGIGKVPVIAVAGHDTASAVAAVPATDTHFAYLSSGTWSLMGIEVEEPIINEASFNHNFTNEGGIEGTTRFLKNITGMWLLEQCRKEWERSGKTYTYHQIVEMAETASSFTSIVNPDDALFANPPSMTEAIATYCKASGQAAPATDAEYIRCIFCSLAARYKEVLDVLKELAPFPIEKLHVIGGGSRNGLLNQFTANAIGIPVIAGPAEATAIGNVMMQAKVAGLVKDRWEMRQLIAEVFSPETFLPE